MSDRIVPFYVGNLRRAERFYSLNWHHFLMAAADEMGLNREPERFLQMKFTSDPLHIDNHTTCSDSFQSTLYSDMRKLNKEACEQFNSLLRSVQASVSYRKFDNYLQALKIFIGFYNLRAMEK